jgi:hypothetical protein
MKNLFIFSIIILFSCKTISKNRTLDGWYYKEGKDFKYELSLNKDSSFVLSQKYFEVNSGCSGKWRCFMNDTILLKCDEADISVKLQSGYLSDREKFIIILSNSKIKIGKVILKKKKK